MCVFFLLLFFVSFCHLYIFFGDVYIQIFAPLKNWVFKIFIIINLWEIFTHSRYRSFIRSVIWKYFLPVCFCPFIFLIVSFSVLKFLSICLFSYWLCFYVISTNSLPNPGSERVYPLFLSTNFIFILYILN